MRRVAAVALASGLLLAVPASPAPATGATPPGTSPRELIWKQEQPGPGGPRVTGTVLAWDPAMGGPIAYGGPRAAQPDTTWKLYGNGWRSLPVGPEPHVDPTGLVYDTDLGELVLVGVDPSAPQETATWLFDGRSWTNVPGPGPGAVRGAAVGYDEETSSVVLFGGVGARGPSGETWTFDGKHWSQKTSGTAPPPRVDAAFGFDSGALGLVLFGGSPGGAETWTWSRGSWQQVGAEAPFPPGRYQILTVQRQALLLGRDWSGNWHAAMFDGIAGAWNELQPDWPAPPPVAAFLAFYDSPTQQIAVLGGPGTGSNPQLWSATVHTQPDDPCPILVEAGHVETSATLFSLKSAFGVQADAEHLSNHEVDVSLVATTEAGVELVVNYDHEVEASKSAGGSEGGDSSWGAGASFDAALEAAEGWDWHFKSVDDAVAFINGPAGQWTQHNLVDVVPVLGQWIADQTGQIKLPQPEKAYVDHGAAVGLVGNGSMERAGTNGTITGHLSDDELTGGGLLFEQATGASRGRTVDFSSTLTGGGSGALGFALPGGGSLPQGGSAAFTQTETGETSFDASGNPTEFRLTTTTEGELATTSGPEGEWKFGQGFSASAGIEVEQASGSATERELTLPLDHDPDAIPTVQALLDAVQNNSLDQQTADRFLGLVHKDGTDTILTYHTTSGTTTTSVGITRAPLTFGAEGEVGNGEERLVNAQAWDSAAGTFTPWTSCLAGMAPKPQPVVPPTGDLPGTIVYETGWPNDPAIELAPAAAPEPPAVLRTPYFSPALSPDGTRLAVDTHQPWEPNSGAGSLVVMNADGGNPRTVYRTTRGVIQSPQWSPSGRRIAFLVDRPGVNRILVAVDADGTHEEVHGEVASGVFAWSPDGSELAFVAKDGGIYTSPVGGGVERHILAAPSGRITAISWAPAHDLLFSEDGASAPGIEEVGPDGTGLRTVLPGGDYQAPSWAPDATHFLAVRRQNIDIATTDGVVQASIGNGDVFSARWGGPPSVAETRAACSSYTTVSLAEGYVRDQLAKVFGGARLNWVFRDVAQSWGTGAALNVLEAIPGPGSGATGSTGDWYFFFAGGCPLGKQSFEADRAATRIDGSTYAVTYTGYHAGDATCCPSAGTKTVRFHWDGSQLTPPLPVADATEEAAASANGGARCADANTGFTISYAGRVCVLERTTSGTRLQLRVSVKDIDHYGYGINVRDFGLLDSLHQVLPASDDGAGGCAKDGSSDPLAKTWKVQPGVTLTLPAPLCFDLPAGADAVELEWQNAPAVDLEAGKSATPPPPTPLRSMPPEPAGAKCGNNFDQVNSSVFAGRVCVLGQSSAAGPSGQRVELTIEFTNVDPNEFGFSVRDFTLVDSQHAAVDAIQSGEGGCLGDRPGLRLLDDNWTLRSGESYKLPGPICFDLAGGGRPAVLKWRTHVSVQLN